LSTSTVLTLGVLSLAYATVSKRLEASPITAPMLFTAAGFLAGPHLLNLVDVPLTGDGFVTLAELALTLLLFTQASRLDWRDLAHRRGLPLRLLCIGLPLTIIAGTLAGLALFGSLVFWEAAVLAVVLAPTDAALGEVVISDPRVPALIRRSLDAESGLNDGLALPFLTIAIAFAAEQTTGGSVGHWVWYTVKTIGISVLVAVPIGYLGGKMLAAANTAGTMSRTWGELGVLLLAVLSFAVVDRLSGSGFFAAFVAGIAMGAVAPKMAARRETTAGSIGKLLVLLVFALFGAGAVWSAFEGLSVQIVLYAALSLTLVRMLPVVIALIGSGLSRATHLYLGWFGPRGTASIIFGLVVIEEKLAATSLIVHVVALTVIASIILHGLSAHPGTSAYVKAIERLRRSRPRAPELSEA
jgi:NhaP-type Na+/H+ or K+/H+ antiporter